MKNTALRPALHGLIALSLLLPLAAFAAPPAEGELAPDFTLKTLDGESTLSLSDYSGKVVYIDFWASWCGPCRRAFPEVKALYSEYGPEGLEVLAVSLDRKTPPAIKFFDEQKVTFPGLHDDQGKVAAVYGVQSIPMAVIIGPDGKIAMKMIGFDPRKLPEIKETIEGLLQRADQERTEQKAEVKG